MSPGSSRWMKCPAPSEDRPDLVAEIGYEEFGDPTGLPVLLLHGFPDDAVRAWDGVIRQLSHERVRMITPYLRGFGPTLITAPEAVSG